MVDFITYPEISYLYDEFMMVRSITLRLFFFFSRRVACAKAVLLRAQVASLSLIVDATLLILLYYM